MSLTQPDNSLQDLTNRKAAIKGELRARMYLYEQTLLVSSVSAIAEYGPVTTLPLNAPDQEIGRVACSHLLQFVPEIPTNLRDQKTKDWQAFAASGARSGKQFRAGAWMIMIDTLNMALRFEAVPVSASGPSLYAGSEISLSASHADIGAAVRRVLKAAAVLQTHGMFEEIA